MRSLFTAGDKDVNAAYMRLKIISVSGRGVNR